MKKENPSINPIKNNVDNDDKENHLRLYGDLRQIVSGQIFSDLLGRFFVMSFKDTSAQVYYENGVTRCWDKDYLIKLANTWPHATVNTISDIRNGLQKHGLNPSDSPFADYDQLAMLNKKTNAPLQAKIIKITANTRKELIQFKRLIPRVKDSTDFEFGENPSASYSEYQIKAAANTVKIADNFFNCIILTSFFAMFNTLWALTVGFSSFWDAFGLTIFVLFIFCLLPDFILKLIFKFIGPIFKLISYLYWNILMKNILKNEILITNELLDYTDRWKIFLTEECKRLSLWKESIYNLRQQYIKKFILYHSLRSLSPWDLNMPLVHRVLESRYPSIISFRWEDMTPWQRAVWDSSWPCRYENQVEGYIENTLRDKKIKLVRTPISQ